MQRCFACNAHLVHNRSDGNWHGHVAGGDWAERGSLALHRRPQYRICRERGCSHDKRQFFVTLIGFDYPAFEAAYPQSNGNPAPVLAGANGQADITISSALLAVQPSAGAALTLTTQSKGRSKALLKMIQAHQPTAVRRR
jgi:hypothetical protein